MAEVVLAESGGFIVDEPATFQVDHRLARPDARAWFDHLQIGDQVQVVSARQVAADRAT